MLPCDCAARADVASVHSDEIDDAFEAFTLVQSRGDYELLKCSTCQTLWIVDRVSRGPLAVRCKSIDLWRTFDDGPYRKWLVVQHHGGVSDQKCLQRGCAGHALKGVAFCVEHLLQW
jgi:hypothetical protein